MRRLWREKSERARCTDANSVIKTDDLMTTWKLIPPNPPPASPPSTKAIWQQSGPWLITLVNIFHFRSLSQMTTGCHWLKAIFLKGEPLLSIRWKWFLCLLGCHCLQELLLIGLEYIAAAVVTAAGNISPALLSRSQRFQRSAFCRM